MKVDVRVKRRAETMDETHRTNSCPHRGLRLQTALSLAQKNAQYRTGQCGIVMQVESQSLG